MRGSVNTRRSTAAPERRREIARAALAVADAEGLDALSMRRLGAEVGLSAMGLYRYFRSKEELYEAMVAAATEDAAVEPPAGEDWREQLRAVARALRRTLERHPSGIQIRLRRPMLTDAALRVTEGGMAILRDAGFDAQTAARGFRTLWLYAFAYAAFNAPAAPDETRRLARAALTGLPPEEFPALTAATDAAVAAMAGDEQFEAGLDMLLDGLAARLS